MKKAMTWGVALMTAAACAHAEMIRLDFGDGAVRDGWTQVLADDTQWSGAERLTASCDVPDYEALLAEEKTRPVYANELSCDYVRGEGNSVLTVRASSGRYKVWLLTGSAATQQSRDVPYYFDTRVAINGREHDSIRLLKEMVTAIEAERRRHGWPEIVYAPIDEPYGTREQSLFAQAANRAIKEIDGVRTYCTMKSWLTNTLSPMVDLRTYGLGFLGHGLPNEAYSHPEQTGRLENTRPEQELWVYPNIVTARSAAPAATGRFVYGLYGYKMGIQGYNPWHHANWRGNPFNEMDHFYGGGRFILPGPDGAIPTPAYEGVREGIDDMRYIYTLRQSIGRTDNLAAALEAAELLIEMRKTIPGYRGWILRYAHRGEPNSRMIDDPEMRQLWDLNTSPAWPNDNMQHYRRRMADLIAQMQPGVTKAELPAAEL